MIGQGKEKILEELLSIKEWRYPYIFDNKQVTLERKELGPWNVWRAEVSKRSIEAVLSQNKISILDLGCNEGFYSFQLADKARSVIGLDAREECIRRANLIKEYYGYKNFNFKQADLRNFDFCNNEDTKSGFDLVLCYGILYHLSDPYLFLKRVFTLVKNTLSLTTFLTDSKYPILTVRKENASMPGSGLDPLSMQPSVAAIICLLYGAGFDLVMRYIPHKISLYKHFEWGHFLAVKLGGKDLSTYFRENNVKSRYNRFLREDQLILCSDIWDIKSKESTRKRETLGPSLYDCFILKIKRHNRLAA